MKDWNNTKKKLMILQIIGKAAELTAAGYGDIAFVLSDGDVVKKPQRQYNKRYKDGSGAAIMPVIPKD